MIPLSLLPRARPPHPDQLLVERLAMPMRRGLILLPFATREYNRCHEAVVAVGTSRFPAGSHVLIQPSAQLAVTFGYGAQERTLTVCTERQVLMTMKKTDAPAELGPEHYLRGYSGQDQEEFALAGQEGFDEGDPRGLR